MTSLAHFEAVAGSLKLPGEAIIDGRPYETIEDLDKVKGLGPARLAALKDKVTFGPVSEAAKKKAAEARADAKAAPRKTAAKAASATPDKKVNINTATVDELDTLPGIGPAKAQAIIAGRPFKSIESIKDVKGIGDATFGKLKDLITIDK